MAVVIEKQLYNQAINEWIKKYIQLGVLSLVLSFLFGLVLWKTLYKPLKYIKEEIGLISDSKFNSDIKLTNIQEFDDLLFKFQHMRQKIIDLIKEIEQKEKIKRHLEVEKLLYQINPHFLHNTLNTIQWFAKINGQNEIDRLVVLLTRILNYNLGKGGKIVTIRDEVMALKDYVALQQIRYDNQFDVILNIDPEITDKEIPRFILQPIVENSIYHGMRNERGNIQVDIKQEDKYVIIIIADNGMGMDEEEVSRLLNNEIEENKKVGIGIGLNYVNRMIMIHYGNSAELKIKSIIGEGTTFTLKIPI